MLVSVIAASPVAAQNLDSSAMNITDTEVHEDGNVVEPLVSTEPEQIENKFEPEFVAVPFIFSTETLSTTFGGAGVLKHAGQAQASILGIGLYSSNSSWVSYLGLTNYQLPKLDQWLFSGEFYRANFKEGIYFVPQGAGEGSLEPVATDSSQRNRILAEGDESFYKLHIKYVLPFGRGADGAALSLIPSRNNDNFSWDPTKSGVSSIELTPFVKTQELVGYNDLPTKAQGLELKLDWDNRDNGKNSTRGGETSLIFTRDFGSSSSTDSGGRESWTTWEFEQSAFFSLGGSSWFPQQTLALNFYLADTPTWSKDEDNSTGSHRPPSFSGVSLGGFEHLRGYSSRQFVGRSAVLYSAEYRVQPAWQPLQSLPLFNLYDVPWWQWVVFTEAGQVADSFSASELHDDMKWTLGAGARFEVESVVVRAEFAHGQDSNQFWVMVNQPF
ncbi:BamA/TamA family outer membrane protein [Shewanella violacea]